MESIIKNQLMNYIEKENFISGHQYGFRTGKSTYLQLLKCSDNWTKSFDNKIPTDIIYLDFNKEFDTVNHHKLIYKLKVFGITGYLLEWIQAFLSDWTQNVVLDNVKSKSSKVVSGVPQGSVLGPVLFLIFINDLEDIIGNKISFVMFADDVKLYHDIVDHNDNVKLQSALQRVHDWSVTWQLRLSLTKCTILHLGSNNPHYQYSLGNSVLEISVFYKDLGVLISEDCKFQKHIQHMLK